MKILLRQRSIAWALAAWFALPGCAAQDPYRVDDDDLKVRWCPESGETTVHFDFGEASKTPGASRLWRGSYHVTVYGERAAMGAGVSHKGILEGEVVSDDDIDPLTAGRAWRLTVRGELGEVPQQVWVRASGEDGSQASPPSPSYSGQYKLTRRPSEEPSSCLELLGSLSAQTPQDGVD